MKKSENVLEPAQVTADPRDRVLIVGGSDRETLLQAGLLHMDTVIVATGNSDANIMTSILANPGSPITRQPLHAIDGLTDRIKIGGVCTDGSWDIALGVTQINDGDRVVCVCTVDGLAALQRLFLA
ncbi:MAG: NAD-binding protein [bacterium]|nr:NAD-binding protein [bacterium]